VVDSALVTVPRLLVVWFAVAATDRPTLFHYAAYLAWAADAILRFAFFLHQRHVRLQWFRKNGKLVIHPVALFGGEVPLLWAALAGRSEALRLLLVLGYGAVGAATYGRRVVREVGAVKGGGRRAKTKAKEKEKQQKADRSKVKKGDRKQKDE
jgi:hypothetical protein